MSQLNGSSDISFLLYCDVYLCVFIRKNVGTCFHIAVVDWMLTGHGTHKWRGGV